jgi:adenylate cyclase
MHLSNHTLGLVSLQAQETARPWVMALWHSPFGQILLYGSLSVHAFCGLVALARRRHYRMPAWEATQMLLGLSIPYLLLVHIVNTRGTRVLTGIDINYPYEIANLWIDPLTRFRQILLVLLVWGHFTIGLHFWLRIHAWYRRAFPAILLFYVLVPIGALLGFAEVGMATSTHARLDPAWFKQMKSIGFPADPHRAAVRAYLKNWIGYYWLALVALVFCGAQIRNLWQRRKRFTMTYPGNYSVQAPIGLSVLEVSRRVGRPHVSVCGGRGRCTTCRIRIEGTLARLPPPNEVEAHALARIGAPLGVRLACQLRPRGDLAVYPLLHPDLVARSLTVAGEKFGEERRVTILFIDLRGSTRLAESRLPYDVVFVLNHYFAEMAIAIDSTGGHYSNFTGDGLMALFGLGEDADHGAHAALDCALRMLENLDRLNRELAAELSEPMIIGVGIHTGDAVIGKMGPPKTPVLSALGEAVNTAARLEGITKEIKMPVAVSRDTLAAAELSQRVPLRDVSLRDRSEPLAVAPLNAESLHELLRSRDSIRNSQEVENAKPT